MPPAPSGGARKKGTGGEARRGIFEDAGDLGCYEEAYLIESWLELRHLRERVTNADRVLEDEIREMLIAPPRIEFLIAAERGGEARHRRAEPAGA
jgi:hypothetical protein